MSQHLATIQWKRNQAVFTDKRYSREHIWCFEGGAKVYASSSPDVVPIPYSNPTYVDPEGAFVASLSSCHMLWFLSCAAAKKFIVDSYLDHAVGLLAKNEQGKLAITVVRLRPQITFVGDNLPTPQQIEQLHHEAHQNCFLANSVKTEVIIETISSES
ncbi:OsmC family protein [Gloeothece citriformis PCC 7424]|uniref:OsmC family protein n=1 Tax=Gloeothece citriformis (strain PCC 7424) TaxID=65393 RepID=B7K7L3_GLOC7|nr:OsmC family protein [Gloeothece citriformis]ACK69781.1 OsmC family protein [Gloeothece citriformis PCC 7424]